MLQRLGLEGNEIGDAGATALSNGIAVSFVSFCVFSFLVWANYPRKPTHIMPCSCSGESNVAGAEFEEEQHWS